MNENLALRGIDSLNLFRHYATREEYEGGTGFVCPPFDPSRRPKSWFDPKAKDSTRQNMTYPAVLARTESGAFVRGDDGNPVTEPLVLSKTEAGMVNIPPVAANVSGAGQIAVPMPLRPLESYEQLVFAGGFAGGAPMVRDTRYDLPAELLEDQGVGQGFFPADRTLLKKIAIVLNVK